MDWKKIGESKMENKEGFSFTYSAEQQKEIQAIRKKYLPGEEDKMEKLRKLHAGPTRKARAVSVTIGVVGALIMGTGMSLVLTEIGILLGRFSVGFGIAVGVGGLVLVALAYPAYNRVLKKERERIAPEILRLADELLN